MAIFPGMLSYLLPDFLMMYESQTIAWIPSFYLKGLTAHGFAKILHQLREIHTRCLQLLPNCMRHTISAECIHLNLSMCGTKSL